MEGGRSPEVNEMLSSGKGEGIEHADPRDGSWSSTQLM